MYLIIVLDSASSLAWHKNKNCYSLLIVVKTCLSSVIRSSHNMMSDNLLDLY